MGYLWVYALRYVNNSLSGLQGSYWSCLFGHVTILALTIVHLLQGEPR